MQTTGSSQEKIQSVDKYLKRCSPTCVLKKCKLNTKGFFSPPLRLEGLQKLGNILYGKTDTSRTAGRSFIAAATYNAVGQHLILKWPSNPSSKNLSHGYILVIVEVG